MEDSLTILFEEEEPKSPLVSILELFPKNKDVEVTNLLLYVVGNKFSEVGIYPKGLREIWVLVKTLEEVGLFSVIKQDNSIFIRNTQYG